MEPVCLGSADSVFVGRTLLSNPVDWKLLPISTVESVEYILVSAVVKYCKFLLVYVDCSELTSRGCVRLLSDECKVVGVYNICTELEDCKWLFSDVSDCIKTTSVVL